jgi:transposase
VFGFVQQRLYLTPKFFERLPTERLIGEGIRPEGASQRRYAGEGA